MSCRKSITYIIALVCEKARNQSSVCIVASPRLGRGISYGIRTGCDEYGRPEVGFLIPAIWLVLSGLLYSLQLSSGSFPKPLSAKEEQHYLQLAAKGDLEARNILVERNLRLVAHIMNKS